MSASTARTGPAQRREAAWSPPRPASLPRPTAAPALCAAAIVLLLWSLVASPILALSGGALLVASLAAWIRELRNESRTEQDDAR
jgi:hypothetical protein